MMVRKYFLILLIGILASFGCSDTNKSTKLIRIPKKVQEKDDRKGDVQNAFFPTVDILFVVDDSGSMQGFQDNLAQNIDLFVASLKSLAVLKYHIGVVTTDMDDDERSGRLYAYGSNPLFVDSSTLGGDLILRSNLMVGTNGSASEEMFSPVKAALSSPLVDSTNAGFYRSNAHLAVIFLTDSEDQSDLSPGEIFDFLKSLKRGDDRKVMSYGVVIPSGVSGCSRDYGEPTKIESFVDMANAGSGSRRIFNICDPDFGKHLTKIRDDMVSQIGLFIYLDELPAVDTIQVFWGTQQIDSDYDKGWVYDNKRNAIHLGKDIELLEQPGAELVVRFKPAKLPGEL